MNATLPTSLNWRPAAALPIGLGLPTLFVYQGSVYLTGGDAWVPGGTGHPDGQRKIYFDKVIRYDADADCWKAVCDLPIPGIHFGAAILENRLFLVGGCDNGHAMNHQVRVKDLPDGEWRTIGHAEHPAWGNVVMREGDFLYSCGGWTTPAANDQQTGDLWRYDLSTPEEPPVRLSVIPGEPRSYHAGALVQGNLYLFGGERFDAEGHRTYFSEAWRYDLQGNLWTRLHDLPAATAAATVAALDGRTILLPGGWCDAAAGDGIAENHNSARVWAYDTQTDAYARWNDLPAPLCGMSFARVGSMMIGAGGEDRSRHRVDWVWRCDMNQ